MALMQSPLQSEDSRLRDYSGLHLQRSGTTFNRYISSASVGLSLFSTGSGARPNSSMVTEPRR